MFLIINLTYEFTGSLSYIITLRIPKLLLEKIYCFDRILSNLRVVKWNEECRQTNMNKI